MDFSLLHLQLIGQADLDGRTSYYQALYQTSLIILLNMAFYSCACMIRLK